ncbi:hypothetical protein ES703_78931 [subsurface metagenome]
MKKILGYFLILLPSQAILTAIGVYIPNGWVVAIAFWGVMGVVALFMACVIGAEILIERS